MIETIVFPRALYDRLVSTTRRRYPRKVFGYLLSRSEAHEPSDFILFEENIRNSDIWQPEFHSYGDYFVDHADAGFVATPQESWRVQKEIWSRGLHEVGVLHSHQRHPANFSRIDWDMHRQRFSDLWHLIISLRNPQLPQVRAFAVASDSVRELPLHVPRERDGPARRRTVTTSDAAKARLRELGRLNSAGCPDLNYADDIMLAIDALQNSIGQEVIDEILSDGLRRGSAERYQEHIAPFMVPIERSRFEMGSGQDNASHFCGESPLHCCELSDFQIMRVPVTNELFGLVETGRLNPTRLEHGMPVVNVTWSESALFALWMGCRLPTEAEWEFCCGAGAPTEWCCESEWQLRQYAWYSANARDQIQAVATRKPNKLGLFDMHGNVWEWCQDDYDQDFYCHGLSVDPLNRGGAGTRDGVRKDKVVRGGSMNALAEMCRTRYRFHEHFQFKAADLGFRLARYKD
ncbi:MAG TPA: SUMF1/EgtB/PvdO family nonheme iron enzyme [Streptosporangiaceae bacterium]|nr:SUMF1/EgtB/PvdO family nonheme iron enzyme [Streptosporangiaceae bacterium]